MPAYAPRPERRRFSPSALALIAGAHAAALVAVLSARMDLPVKERDPPIILDPIPVDPVFDPLPPEPRPPTQGPNQRIDRPKPIVDSLPAPGPVVEDVPLPVPNPGPVIGGGIEPVPLPMPAIGRTGPRFITAEHAVRPPYPESKRRLEEEAALRLRLSIDERGRVIAVKPVGRADPVFLDAARRHILKAWRYKPATEGGSAIASSTVITLKFEID